MEIKNLHKDTEGFYLKFFESIINEIEQKHYDERFIDFSNYVDTPLVNDFLQSIPQNILANKEFVKKLIDIDPIAYRVIERTQEKDQKEITMYALDNSVPVFYDLAPYIPQSLRTVEFLHDFLLVDAFYSKDEIDKYNKQLFLKVENDPKLFSLFKICKEDVADNKNFIIEMIEAGGPEVYLLASDTLKNDLEVALTACSFVQPDLKSGELEKSDLIKYLPKNVRENPEFFIRAAKSNYDFSFWFPKQQQTNVKYLMKSVNLNPEKFLSCVAEFSKSKKENMPLLEHLVAHAFDFEKEIFFGKSATDQIETDDENAAE